MDATRSVVRRMLTEQAEEPREVFHGTVWQAGEEPFDQLDPGYNDYGAVWFTDVAEDAVFFATERHDRGGGDQPVILRGKLELQRPFIWQGEEVIEIPAVAGDEPYEFSLDLDDREGLYDVLLRLGHDAFVIPSNYPRGGDDIAVLRPTTFHVTGVKLQQADETWSDWMDFEVAADLFREAT